MKLLKIAMSAIILACGCLTTTFLSAEAATLATPSTTEKYTNKDKQYSLDYPSQWQRKEVPAIDFVLFAPPKGTDTQVHASMNVIAEKVDAPVTLAQFYNESVGNISTELKEVKIESNGESNLNGTPSKWINYSHSMQGISFRVLQYFIVNGDRVYLLTFSALSDDFATYKPEFDKIANSFKILKDESTTAPTANPAMAPVAPATPAVPQAK